MDPEIPSDLAYASEHAQVGNSARKDDSKARKSRLYKPWARPHTYAAGRLILSSLIQYNYPGLASRPVRAPTPLDGALLWRRKPNISIQAGGRKPYKGGDGSRITRRVSGISTMSPRSGSLCRSLLLAITMRVFGTDPASFQLNKLNSLRPPEQLKRRPSPQDAIAMYTLSDDLRSYLYKAQTTTICNANTGLKKTSPSVWVVWYLLIVA